MGRNRRKKQQIETFYMLTEKMMQSEAWANLDPYAIAAFVHIAIKYKGNNKNDLSLTYAEASCLMDTHRFKKSIDMLVEFGFIDIVRSGGVWKKCNIFALSERWRLFGTDKFLEGKKVVVDSNFNPMGLSVN